MENFKRHKEKIIIILVVIVVFIYPTFYFHNRNNCSTIAVISITGEIVSSPRYNDDGSIYKGDTVAVDVIEKIRKAKKDSKVKAIVFVIDSSGGDSQSGEEIARAIKEVKKPTVALIRSQGQSSAYWIASATGHIIASETSDTGGIGTTMSYIDNAKQNEDNGLNFNQLSSGKYKDMGNPDKPLTVDEKKLAMEQVDEFASILIEEIVQNRNLPRDEVQAMADGSTITGSNALDYGLIDEIGSFADVDRYLSTILKRNVDMCIPVSKVKK